MLVSLLSVAVAAALPLASAGPLAPFKMWCLGNCDVDVTTVTTPGVVLMGGGTDTNEAFEWQIKHANHGDFLVLRASGDDAYNEYIYNMSTALGYKLNSVTTILFQNAKASADDAVLKAIRNAETVFFAGGDQGEYIDYWAGTDVQTILQSKISTQTIGGTSAGLAILGNWVYTAVEGSAVSDEAMMDPYDKYNKELVPAFLKIPFLETVLTDTHFVTRNRMGRMLTFAARIKKDYSIKDGAVSRSVGVDEHTALLLDVETGDVETVGVGTAYICSSDHAADLCVSGKPLTFKNVECTRLSGLNGDRYSFKSFTGDGTKYVNDITAGHLTDFPYGPSK